MVLSETLWMVTGLAIGGALAIGLVRVMANVLEGFIAVGPSVALRYE